MFLKAFAMFKFQVNISHSASVNVKTHSKNIIIF